MTRSVVALQVLIGLLLTGQLCAQGIENACLRALQNDIRPGSWISIVSADNESIRAKLLSADFSTSMLSLVRSDSTTIRPLQFKMQDIGEIRYRKAGKFRPLHPILGFVVGSVIGHFVENVIVDPGASAGPFRHYTHRGSFFGGLSGVVVGATASLLIPAERVVVCRR